MSVYDDYQFIGFNLFFHEKGQFWPKNIFKPIKKFFINPNKLKTYSFFIQKDQKVMLLNSQIFSIDYFKIKDETTDCIEDSRYSFTDCLNNFIAEEVGCNLHWFTQEKFDKCVSNNQFERMKVRFFCNK